MRFFSKKCYFLRGYLFFCDLKCTFLKKIRQKKKLAKSLILEDRKSTRLNSKHLKPNRITSFA
jgi:hypothetical protein